MIASAGLRRTPRHVTALFAAALLPLTACGGSASAPSSAPAASASASAPASASTSASNTASEPAASGAASPGAVPEALSFTGTTLDGTAFDAATLVGKPSVLWFWAPWCPTCLQQAPGVREAAAANGGTVNMVGIGGLDSANALPAFVKLAKIEAIPHLADDKGEIYKHFGISEQSYFVFLDAGGNITFKGKLGYDEIAPKIAALS